MFLKADFLGLDNIGVFDRSATLPIGGHLEQSDGTSWMAMYCLNMLAIALELAKEDKVYEDVASKFFEHFVYISDAMNNLGEENTELWNEARRFLLRRSASARASEISRSNCARWSGLIPLFAVETLEEEWLDNLPEFKKRTDWFLKNRPDLTDDIACMQAEGRENRHLLAVVNDERLQSDFAAICFRKTNFCPTTAFALFRVITKRIRMFCELGGERIRGRLRTGRIAHAECSAATRTGAVRSGFRSIIF